ncbi:MAG: ribosomal protection-like ABC-F family protein [Anaerolineae bacterium]
MLVASNLAKRYGDVLLFEGVELVLNAGDRVGLVGPNGCGKTTLLRVLTGDEPADVGSIQRTPPDARVGYLPQVPTTFAEDACVRDTLAGPETPSPEELAHRVEELARRLADASGDELARAERAYAQAVDALARADEQLPEHRLERVLAGLDLDHLDPDAPIAPLSGGEQTRLGLARLLLQRSDILLLDEPTNHLDIDGLEWLEGYLQSHHGAILVVSHDRTFLDRTVTRILEMDPLTHAVREYAGDYTEYTEAKARERAAHEQAYRKQQERIARLESAVRGLEGQARKVEHETIHYHYRKIAKKVARQAVVRRKRIERMLSDEERVEKPRQTWQMKLEFVETPHCGQEVVRLDGIAKGYGERTLFADVELLLRREERVALVGPNGSGKTTLLRLITGEEKPAAGTVTLGTGVRWGYLAQGHDTLDPALTPYETVRRAAPLDETDARRFLHLFLFAGDEVFQRIGNLSSGERARLALGTLVLGGCNLLLLDEPTNHLDIPSRERFEEALSNYEGTVLAVSHDRAFIAKQATSLWAIEDGTIHVYQDLGHWRSATARS